MGRRLLNRRTHSGVKVIAVTLHVDVELPVCPISLDPPQNRPAVGPYRVSSFGRGLAHYASFPAATAPRSTILHIRYSLMYVVSGRCFRFATSCAIPNWPIRLESAEVGEKSPQNLQIFRRSKCRGSTRPPLVCTTFRTSDILAKVPPGGLED